MTITAFASIQTRLWRGYDDPGLPVGMWLAHGQVVGDASGGEQQVGFDFQAEDAPVSSRFWNIEQIDSHKNSTITLAAFISSLNFDRDGAASTITRRDWLFTYVNNLRSVAAIDYVQLPKMPIFLGNSTFEEGIASQVFIGTANVLNVVLVVTIQGYIWEARSILSQGGLRRPLDTLYG